MSSSKRSKTAPRAGRIKLADVATASGVHYSTVSRVLRPGSKGRISDAVAEHVRAVARELGYQPNSVAASMRTNSTYSIGLIVHDMSDPVYPPILTGIEEVLSPQGFAVLVGNTGYDLAVEMDVVNRMASRLVDGIFLATTRLEDPIVERCQDLDIPLVSVLRQTQSRDTPAVINDCLGGMQALTRQVLAWGHRDIAVILAPQNLSTGRERWRGISDVLSENGMTLPEHRIVHVEHMSVDEGERAARTLLAAGAPPEAIICVNDLVAIGAIRACRAAGLNVPRDIGISGYNDIPLVDMIDPPLTTVRMNLKEIGRTAAELMLAHMAPDAPPSRTVRIDAELVLRASLRNLNG